MKNIVAGTLLTVLLSTTAVYAVDCDSIVVDDAHLFTDVSRVEASAKRLGNQGATVRVRTFEDVGGKGNMDKHVVALRNQCPSWQSPDGKGWKSTMLVMAYANEKLVEMRNEEVETSNNARMLRDQGKVDSALALAEELVTLRKKINTAEVGVAPTETAVKALESTVAKVKSKHQEMLDALDRLKTLDASTKNAEKAAKSIKAAGASFDGPSVDGLSEKIEKRWDRANADLENAVGGLKTPNDDVKKAKAEALLASL